jgi:DNA-binding response OmpR family regulator
VLIEDDASFAETLACFLAKEGHTVARAVEGERGIQLANEGSHDLVLLDLQLPDMDGLGALERIKAGEANTAVIVMTAHGSIETAVHAMRLRCCCAIFPPRA